MAAAPASSKARATSSVSSRVWPPSTQSVAEMRTVIGRSAGHTSRTAANTSSGNRSRPVHVAAVLVGAAVGHRGQEADSR